MKAVVLEKTCSAKELEVSEIPLPSVSSGRVLVKIIGFGINRSEIILRQEEADEDYIKLPVVPGIECVGEVIDPSDSSFNVGDKVVCLMGGLGRSFNGSYAEYTLVPSKNVFKIRNNTLTNLSMDEIIAIPETFYTSYGSLFECLKLNKNDTILIRGGTSAAGITAIKLAKAVGATVIATSRSKYKMSKLLGYGADYSVIDDGNVSDKIFNIYSEGIDKVLDFIGPAVLKDSMKTLKEGGCLCITGILGDKEFVENFNPITDISNGRYLTSFYSNYPTQEVMDNMFKFIIENEVDVVISKTYNSLEKISEAHELMENNKVNGKIIFKLE
ncbi:zinc-binding dehydrogenase [Methanosphaera sp.]